MKPFRTGILVVLAVARVVPALAQDVKAVTGASVIGAAGGATIPDAVVVIDGTRLGAVGPRATTAVPANAVVIDARGKFVIPGLADMHNHARSGSSRAQQNLTTNLTFLLASGVTTIFNPSISRADFAQLKTATAADAAPYPRFFGTGPIITIEGDFFGAMVGSPTPDTPGEALAAIKELKAAGVDAIKINRDDLGWSMKQRVPLMKADVLAALVQQAHQEGLKAYAHAPMLAQAKEALRAGADGLMHGIIDEPVDQEFLDLMKRNKAVYVATSSLYEDVADVASWARRQAAYDEAGRLSAIVNGFTGGPGAQQFEAAFNNSALTKRLLPTQRANLKKVFDAGVPVVMGTDAGFLGILMGVSSQAELALMVEAGLTPDAALRAATINAARMLGREAMSGTIETGKQADMIVLDADPLVDIGNVRRIHRVIKGGVVHDPSQLLAGMRTLPPVGVNK